MSSDGIRIMREAFARIGLGLAILLGLLGLVITFIPGAEASYFAVVAGLALTGLISTRWQTRSLALLVALASGAFAIDGYFRGLRYQARHRNNIETHRP